MNKDNLLKFEDGRGIFSFEIKISENRIQDEETGFLYCYDAVFGHTGVQKYYAHEINLKDKMPNEIITVHRFAEDVFSESAMASIKGKSVTQYHPTVAVTKNNFKDLEVGTILDVRKEGENIVGDIVIKDADSIMDILEGRTTSLSLGYRAKLIPINDNEYKQTELHINHLAIVSKGRAVNARIIDEALQENKEGNGKMKLFDFFKGKKVQINDDETLTILDTEDEVEKQDQEPKEEKVEKNDQEEVKEQKELEDEKEVKDVEEEKKEEEIKPMSLEQLQALKDELRAELKEELQKEMTKKEVEFKDSIKIETVEIKDNETNKQSLVLNFEKDEKLRKAFWDKYTNPMAHGGDFKALKDFRNKANQTLV